MGGGPAAAAATLTAAAALARCKVSSLSLETYIQLYDALTKGQGVVQAVGRPLTR